MADAHPDLDEMRPQRALRQLEVMAVVAHGIVVADNALFVDAEDVTPSAGGVRHEGEPGCSGSMAKRALWAGK